MLPLWVNDVAFVVQFKILLNVKIIHKTENSKAIEKLRKEVNKMVNHTTHKLLVTH